MEANVVSSEACSVIGLAGRLDFQCKMAFVDATDAAMAAHADEVLDIANCGKIFAMA